MGKKEEEEKEEEEKRRSTRATKKGRRNIRGWENARVRFFHAPGCIQRDGESHLGFFTGDRLNSAFETVQSNRIGQKGSFNGCGHHAKNTFSRERSLFSVPSLETYRLLSSADFIVKGGGKRMYRSQGDEDRSASDNFPRQRI